MIGGAPCKGCEKRVLGCHSTCPDYLEFKAKCEKVRQARWVDIELWSIKHDGIAKWDRRMGRNKWSSKR